MKTQKDRRKNGYVTPRPTVPPKELLRNNLFVESHYSDWDDHRDGFRDWYGDFKQIKLVDRTKVWDDMRVRKRIEMNQKQELLLQRRAARKMRARTR